MAGIITNRYATDKRTAAAVFRWFSLEYHTTVILGGYYIFKVTGTPQRNLGKTAKDFLKDPVKLHLPSYRILAAVPARVGTLTAAQNKPITFSFFIIILHFGEKTAQMRSFFFVRKCLINVVIYAIMSFDNDSRRESYEN